MDSQTHSFCTITIEQRQAILLLEALGLIHDIGKFSDKFLKSMSLDGKEYEFNYDLFVDPRAIELFSKVTRTVTVGDASDILRSWMIQAETPEKCAFSERTDLTTYLNAISITDWHGTAYTLAELAPFVMNPSYTNDNKYKWNALLGKPMTPGLLIGFMHGAAHIDKEDSQDKQTYNDLNRATPFGHETSIACGVSSDILKQLPLQNLANVTDSLEKRREWLNAMQVGMKQAIADTRRPQNDVTLWDWGYLVASLTKAAAHYLFFSTNAATYFDEIPLVVLRINIDMLGLYAESDRISDLLGKKDDLKQAFDEVREKLEYDWVLGNLLFHDETGAYYLLPGNILTPEKEIGLREEIQKCFPDDLRPRVHLGNPVTARDFDKRLNQDNDKRKAAIREFISNPRKLAFEEPPVQFGNNLYLFEEEWTGKRPKNAEICTVCGKYPVGYPDVGVNGSKYKKIASWATHDKAKERHVCCYCLQRRGRRAKEWGKALSDVSDKQIGTTVWIDEVADGNGRIALFTGMFGLDDWLDGKALETTHVSKKTPKQTSPSRLFRIAETARAFWETLCGDPLNESSGIRDFRLRLVPDPSQKLDLGSFHTYELVWKNKRIGVVWDGRSFLTTENLEAASRLFGLEPYEICEYLKNEPCVLKLPSSFGSAGKVVNARLSLASVENAGTYYPAIPLIAEPSVCMALLPAERALDYVRKAIQAYSDEMNRVQDRLPLGIGLVFFPSRTPVRSIMEAGRSMLGMLSNNSEEDWCLQDVKKSDDGRAFIFTNHKELGFKKGFIRRDSSNYLIDPWYLWHRVVNEDDTITIKEFDTISKNQKLRVKPGRFDFEFLDTSGRRFDISYDQKGRRPKPSRPWYLADVPRLLDLWKEHFGFLSPSQRTQVIGLIENKRREWEILLGLDEDEQGKPQLDVFRRFVEDTLAGANWPNGHLWQSLSNSVIEQLVIAGVDGSLRDLAELHTFIMKE
ncbi:MAG: hypothetical protein HGA97_10635 [Chlorobiaceae bacterium]|nr:hypothetical protein [Chlorobiaceae bacterium]